MAKVLINKDFFMLIRNFRAKIREFWIRHDKLYTPKQGLPDWIPPLSINSNENFDESIKYDVFVDMPESSWVTLAGIKFGVFKKCVLYDEYYILVDNFCHIYPQLHKVILDVLTHYSTENIVLQAKLKNNTIFGFKLYIDNVEQSVSDTNTILQSYNLQMLPIQYTNKEIDKNTKESLKAQKIILNNRQMSKTIFL